MKDLAAKKAVFWSMYALDKGLSLQLGRTSILQDYDISTTFTVMYPAEPELHCWHELALSWTEFARFQGRVYTELYTVASVNGSQQVREKQARKLAAELLEWRPRQMWVSYTQSMYRLNLRTNIFSRKHTLVPLTNPALNWLAIPRTLSITPY